MKRLSPLSVSFLTEDYSSRDRGLGGFSRAERWRAVERPIAFLGVSDGILDSFAYPLRYFGGMS